MKTKLTFLESPFRYSAPAYAALFTFACSCYLFFSLLPVAISGQTVQGRVIPLDNGAQLFIDDYLIEKADKVSRQAHTAEKFFPNPVLTYTKPWEGHCVIAWGSVIYDKEEQIFKCWYEVYRQNLPREKQTSLCYATSKDGFHWEKPTLNLVEYEGSKENNIIFQPRDGIDSAVIIKDNEDSDPSRRYKMMFYLMAEKTGPREGPWGLYTASSPDGLRWSQSTQPVIKAGDRSGFYYHPQRKTYVFLSRPGTPSPITKVHRWIGLWESSDFRTFGEMRPVLEPDLADGPGTEFYSLQPFAYESVFLGYLEIFYHGESDARYRRLDTQLAVSRDGLNWSRAVDRKIILPFGPVGSWDGGWAFPSSNPPIRVGDRLFIYYQGRRTFHWGTRPYSFVQGGETYEVNDPRYGHIGAIGLAFMRVDGFASMKAEGSPGVLLTRPLMLPKGRQLTINAMAKGSIKVAVLDESGRPLPKFALDESIEVTGDSLEHRVRWKQAGEGTRIERPPCPARISPQ